ncbi:MAG TPA: AAA family ATPase, partial [Candidatus Paceibacterota bacterium]
LGLKLFQHKKIEKARAMRVELSHTLTEYLSREHAWIRAEEARVSGDAEHTRSRVRELEEKLKTIHAHTGVSQKEAPGRVRELEEKLARARSERELVARELGRAEGAAEAHSRERVVPTSLVREFTDTLQDELTKALDLSDASSLRESVGRLHIRVRSFVEKIFGALHTSSHTGEAERLSHALEKAQKEEVSCVKDVDEARREALSLREAEFTREQEATRIESEIRTCRAFEAQAGNARSELSLVRQRFEEEVREGVALVGAGIRDYEKAETPKGALSEDRREQEKRRRDIERLKIKIEESGIGNSDAVTQEYTQTMGRDQFLGKEVADLEASAAKLKDIIADLEETMDKKFTEGLGSINEALTLFFTKLFGGGSAKMHVETPKRVRRVSLSESEEDEYEASEEDELYAGLSITVHLPRKKVRGLEVLSGGERALTSIALIFAISQVHPPPFLILDETDAALDEANSRRFADMIKELSKKSQLVVITHNRATMAASGELYGVTMGSDGVSTLLSVKLEEAERIAK